jgi:hypothetical protein
MRMLSASAGRLLLCTLPRQIIYIILSRMLQRLQLQLCTNLLLQLRCIILAQLLLSLRAVQHEAGPGV